MLSFIRLNNRFSTNDLLWFIFYVITIIISGRRGLIFVSIVFVLICLFLGSSWIGKFFTIASIFTCALILLPWMLSNTMLLSSYEESNLTKIGHLESYLDIVNYKNFFFGNGLGAYYYSNGIGGHLSQTELTLIDLFRYVGVPLALLFFLTLLLPKLYKQPFVGRRKEFSIAFLLFLLLSITNPVLIQSYGMLVVLWYWSAYLGESEFRIKK